MVCGWLSVLGLGKNKNSSPEVDLYKSLDSDKLPVHIAIIMDGNGRWATQRGLPRALGHRAGVDSLRDIVRTCSALGVGFLTVYAFSTENWKRPAEEVATLMDLLAEYLYKELNELNKNNVRVKTIGRIDELPVKSREALAMAEKETLRNTGLTLNLALNYGGRNEITEAVKQIGRDASAGKLNPDEIDENIISGYLYTAGIPDPDLLIRPSGEKRISNFLLWQVAYAEFWYSPVLWPDFRKEHLLEALVDYQNRQRRFGGLHQSKR
ncbi:isoprenyl transferase [Phosphitispora sp. TUW77]|uniref:isoprenyl transferase n=1 Tax=Phosphitispora sp. TUW77 TaxID=3152361 RepID=UPI003AB6A4A6